MKKGDKILWLGEEGVYIGKDLYLPDYSYISVDGNEILAYNKDIEKITRKYNHPQTKLFK